MLTTRPWGSERGRGVQLGHSEKSIFGRSSGNGQKVRSLQVLQVFSMVIILSCNFGSDFGRRRVMGGPYYEKIC